jgi:hypothetical protein
MTRKFDMNQKIFLHCVDCGGTGKKKNPASYGGYDFCNNCDRRGLVDAREFLILLKAATKLILSWDDFKNCLDFSSSYFIANIAGDYNDLRDAVNNVHSKHGPEPEGAGK